MPKSRADNRIQAPVVQTLDNTISTGYDKLLSSGQALGKLIALSTFRTTGTRYKQRGKAIYDIQFYLFLAPTFYNDLTHHEVRCGDSRTIANGCLQFIYLLTILPFTISCTTACACPNLLTAEQLYVPESLPRTFLRSNFRPDTIDRQQYTMLKLNCFGAFPCLPYAFP